MTDPEHRRAATPVDVVGDDSGLVTEITADAFVEGETLGAQTFSAERGQHELRAAREAHKQRLERERAEHELREATKDNDQRRRRELLVFYVVVAVALVALVAGFAIGVGADNDDTRRFGQGLVTLLLGAIAGGLAGYFTGKDSKSSR